MSDNLKKITKDRLDEISRNWEQSSDPDVFSVEYHDVFDRMAHELGSSEYNDVHYEVVGDGGSAQAILEIIDSKQGAQTKLLRYYFSPEQLEHSLKEDDITFKNEVAEVFAKVITEVIFESLSRNCRDIKIYARHDEMYDVLKALKNEIDDTPYEDKRVSIKAMFEGRWLRILFSNTSS